MSQARPGMRFIGVELDRISGRIAKALHPDHDIRIENFRDTRLPENRIDAVIGNVPFADLKLDYRGQKLSLHDLLLRQVDRRTETRRCAGAGHQPFHAGQAERRPPRSTSAAKADFLGAIRLPSDAFKREGTAVVTDIVFLRKRAPGEPAHHADPEWLRVCAPPDRGC